MLNANFLAMLDCFKRNSKVMGNASRKFSDRFVPILFKELSASHGLERQFGIFIPQKFRYTNESVFHRDHNSKFLEDVKAQKSPHFWGLCITLGYRRRQLPLLPVGPLALVAQSSPLLVLAQLHRSLAR
jgi:hypothetical protein